TIEAPPPETLLTHDQLFQVEIYPPEQRATRLGLQLRAAGHPRAAVVAYAQATETDGRGWYELARLLASPEQARAVGVGDTPIGGLLSACMEAACDLGDPSALNALAGVCHRGRKDWPVARDPVRATALSRAGLRGATDVDLLADLHLRLAVLALEHPGEEGCPTLEEGRAHLEAAEAQDRPQYVESLRALRERYAALDRD
ncbi:MAG: hypothetical protein KDD82_24360, partial [Planctomycetes bacterium]|nr:hypothetical protein [Planctomycetota bacterium]